jgi:hypothetical protein
VVSSPSLIVRLTIVCTVAPIEDHFVSMTVPALSFFWAK